MSAVESDQTGATPIILDAQHPWPSLQAFREEHSALFRGRDEEITDLVRRVKRRLLTVLFGISGLGKTSLLQAGLFPALRRERFVPILIRLDHDNNANELGEQVRQALSRETESPQITAHNGSDEQDLWSLFHRRDLEWRSSHGDPLIPVLVFDQFEEIFTRRASAGDSDRQRRHFLLQLAALTENHPPDALSEAMEKNSRLVERYDFHREAHRIVISLREDYLPQLEDLRRRMPSIMENRLRLTRMTRAQALEAVLEPGRHVVKDSVAHEIVGFVAGSSLNQDEEVGGTRYADVDPSLLSLICSELNGQRLAEGLPGITSELLRGRSNRILDDFYIRCFEFLPENNRAAARAFVEDKLLTPAGHRGTVALESAEGELQNAGVPPEALHELVRHRLLQFDERHGLQRVELAHDVLTAVVGQHRDRRREAAALDRVRQQEQRELAEAKQREELANAQIKRLRKARFGYAAAGLVFAGLCLCSLWFANQARNGANQARDAKASLELKNDELTRSNKSVQQANEAVERVVDHVTTALLDELAAAKGAQITTLQRVVKRGLAAFAEIPPKLAATPRFRVNRAEMLQAAAQSYSAQNPSLLFEKAKSVATEAISELKSVRAELSGKSATTSDDGARASPTPAPQGDLPRPNDNGALIPLKLTAAYLTRGDVIRTRAEAELNDASMPTLSGLFADAESDYDAAFEIAEPFMRTNSKESAVAAAVAKCLMRQGDVIKDRWNRAYGKAQEFQEIADKLLLLNNALEKYTRGFEICSQLPEGDKEALSLGADLHNKIGNIHLQKAEIAAMVSPAASLTSSRDQEFESARESYAAALSLRRKLLELDPDSIVEKQSLAYTMNNMARLDELKLADRRWVKNAVDRRNLALEAEKLYKDRLELAQQIAKADPQNFFYQSDLSEAFRHLAKLYDSLRASEGGNKALAEELYRAAAKAGAGQVQKQSDESPSR